VLARPVGCDLASDDVDIGSPFWSKRPELLEHRNGRVVRRCQRLADLKLAALAVSAHVEMVDLLTMVQLVEDEIDRRISRIVGDRRHYHIDARALYGFRRRDCYLSVKPEVPPGPQLHVREVNVNELIRHAVPPLKKEWFRPPPTPKAVGHQLRDEYKHCARRRPMKLITSNK
jgi:hypothetical protein